MCCGGSNEDAKQSLQWGKLMAHFVFTSDSCSLQVTGVVKAVHVKEGDTVDEDQILVEIE